MFSIQPRDRSDIIPSQVTSRQGVLVSRWFWFGLLTSSGFLISNQLLRLALHPSAAAALSALVGTSIALCLVRLVTPSRPLIKVVHQLPRERLDLTPIPVGLGLAGTPVPPSARSAAGEKRPGNGAGGSDCSALIQELAPLGFHPAVEEFKRRLLCQTIAACGGNRAEAARRLGLQRTYLYRLTKQLNVSATPSSSLGLSRGLAEPAERGARRKASPEATTSMGPAPRSAEGQGLA
jgi:hypothetical protein